MQPEPSLVLSQLVQRHAGPSLPLARQPSPPTQRLQQAAPAAPSSVLQAGTAGHGGPLLAAGSAKSPAPSAGLDPPGSSTPHQQQRAQLKGQKRRIPPTSKVQLDLPRPPCKHYLGNVPCNLLSARCLIVVPDFHFVIGFFEFFTFYFRFVYLQFSFTQWLMSNSLSEIILYIELHIFNSNCNISKGSCTTKPKHRA